MKLTFTIRQMFLLLTLCLAALSSMLPAQQAVQLPAIAPEDFASSNTSASQPTNQSLPQATESDSIIDSLTPITEAFIVEDVRVRGLNIVSIGTFFTQLPIGKGDRIDSDAVRRTIRTLFDSGLFENIQVLREDNALVIRVLERPIISDLTLEGNVALPSESLLAALDGVGLAKGELLRQSTVINIKNELLRQYVSQGRYGATVDINLLPVGNNQILVQIEIKEGQVSSIDRITIHGNDAFSDAEILGEFELGSRDGFWWLGSNYKYAREALIGDIERMRSFYLEQGYLEFELKDIVVSLSEDKSSVYISLIVEEGSEFTIDSVDTAGRFPLTDREIQRQLFMKPGDVYDQNRITRSEQALKQALQGRGYSFSQVKAVPEILEEEGKEDRVRVVFYITNAERRGYVRRIEFQGNHKTLDKVLRREVIQQEGAVVSSLLLDRSQQRLERSGFFRSVEKEVVPINGINDQVDVVFKVIEDFSGSLNFSLSYSEVSTFAQVGITQNNFLGTGINLNVGLTTSDNTDEFSLSVQEPYISQYGLSRNYQVTQRNLKYDTSLLSGGYLTDSTTFQLGYGLRLSDSQGISAGFGLEQTDITDGSTTYYIIEDYSNSEGAADYQIARFQGSWNLNTLNRAIFPTKGHLSTVGFDLGLGADSSYLEFQATSRNYFQINQDYTIGLHLRGYWLDTLEKDVPPPFFKFRQLGGVSSIRGYDHSTLGPWVYGGACAQSGNVANTLNEGASYPPVDYGGNNTYTYYYDLDDDQDYALSNFCYTAPLGAPIVFSGTLELALPFGDAENRARLKTTLFMDFGNGYSFDCDERWYWSARCNAIKDIRLDDTLWDTLGFKTSMGLSIVWLTPFGPLNFLFTRALNPEPWDHTENFIFTQGQIY